jgi:hypothetical protein
VTESRIGSSVAESGSLSPDREICSRIRLCRRIGRFVARSGSLSPDREL